MDYLTIELTPREIRLAGVHAVERRVERLQDNHADKTGKCHANGLAGDFLGVLGEVAFAKWVNAYHSGVARLGNHDVAGVEVRTVGEPGAGLQVYEKARRLPYVLAYCQNPLDGVKFIGWLHPNEPLEKTWYCPCIGQLAPCWVVPQMFLKPMEVFENGV